MTIRQLTPIAVLLVFLSACGNGGQTPVPALAPQSGLVEVLENRPNLRKFAAALETSGVAAALLPSGAYTIFAPMDRAVDGPLDAATVRHHVLLTKVTFSDMAGESTSYDTLNNDQLEVDVTEQIAVGSGLMVESDIEATNGVIHVIDSVLTPGTGAAPATN